VVSDTITVGNAPVGLAVTPDGKHVYVANAADNSVSVIATATGEVSDPIPVGASPVRVAICPA
jgi:YVTN family beta-propeller protein